MRFPRSRSVTRPQATTFAPAKVRAPKKPSSVRMRAFLVPRWGFTPQGGINFESPEAKQQKQGMPKGIPCFCGCLPLLLSVLPHTARKGMCARETFVGFPLRVQSKAANGGPDFCGARISSTKREPPFGWLSFGASLGIRTPDTLLKRQVLYLLS